MKDERRFWWAVTALFIASVIIAAVGVWGMANAQNLINGDYRPMATLAPTPIPLAPGTYQACGPNNVTIVVGACATPTVAPTGTPAPTAHPTIAPTGTPTPGAIPTPSPSGTVSMAGSGSSIRDIAGNEWVITSAGQIAINGKIDAITSAVREIAYVNGVVWQKNVSNTWWSKASPTATWLPPGGTSVSPVP